MRFLTGISFYFIVIGCMLVQHASAQHDTLSTKPMHYLFTRNHFSLALENGLTRGRTAPIQGPDKLHQSYAVAHSLMLYYTVQASRPWSVTFCAGTGFLPFYFRPPYEEWYLFRYWDNLDGAMHLKLGADLSYRFNISDRHFTEASAGVRVLKLRQLQSSLGGSYTDTAMHPVYRYEMNFITNPAWNPAFSLGIGQYKILRNYDLLGVTLSFQHTSSSLFNGYYQMADYLKHTYSRGTFINRGNVLYLGLRYTFTQAQRQARYAKILNKTSETDARSLRKTYRMRFQKPIAPHTFFITASGNTVLQKTVMNDLNGVLGSALYPSVIPELAFTLFGAHENFAELRISRQEYLNGYRELKSDGDCKLCGSFASAFDAVATGLGAGKRLTTKKHQEILNVHAGLSVNFSNTTKGLSGRGTASIRSGTDTIFSATNETYQQHKIFPLLYLGVSHDFRIRGKLYFSLAYRYYQGFLPVSETRFRYTSVWTTGIQNVNSINYGSQHNLQFGLRYNLGKLF